MPRPTHDGRCLRAPSVAALGLATLLNTSAPTSAQQPGDEPPVSRRMIDVTGDGRLDRLELTADGSLRVFVNLGGRIFDAVAQTLPSTPVADILVGDLDDDGRIDLYLVSPKDNLALVGDGTGRFTDATERLGLADGGPGVRAQLLDVDEDGHADLLLRNASEDVVFWKLPGLGFARSADTPEVPTDDDAPTTSDGPSANGGVSGPGAGDPSANGGAGSVDPPADLPPGVQPLLPPGHATSLGSGGPGSLTSGPRVGGASGGVASSGPAPTPTLPPTLAATLDAKYVNDDAGEVDGADIPDGVLTGADVSTTVGDVTHLGGTMGIGTPAQPGVKLHLSNPVPSHMLFVTDVAHGVTGSTYVDSGGVYTGSWTPHDFHLWTGGVPRMTVTAGGDVGIGTLEPASRFHVAGNATVTGDATVSGSTVTDAVRFGSVSGVGRSSLLNPGEVGLWTNGARLKLSASGEGGYALVVNPSGNVGIGEDNPATKLHVAGTARVTVLEITGGADIVEGFASSETLEPGTVVVIDAEAPGEVVASTAAYDAKVAGVVSGAGGVLPGLSLTQDGVLDGDVPLAMTGRVYVKCSAENGPIRPGDRLTTAALPGHAMKVTDASRADGAVIGKAMSALDDGTGLVLVLVNLQ